MGNKLSYTITWNIIQTINDDMNTGYQQNVVIIILHNEKNP